MRHSTSPSPPEGADRALPAGRRVAEPDPCVPRAARLRGRSSAPDSGEDIPRVSSRSSQPDHRSSRGFYRCCAASPDGRKRSGAWYLLRGLVAALRALELGAEVTLLEKATGSVALLSTPAATSGPTKTCRPSGGRPRAATSPCRGLSWSDWGLTSSGWRATVPLSLRARRATR